MPSFCAVFGCSNRGDRNWKKSFFRFPSIKNNKGKICPLLVRKKELWLQAIKRKDLTDQKLKYARICSDHFSNEKPSNNENDLDYVPNLNLGYVRKAESSCSTARRNRRKRKELMEQDYYDKLHRAREPQVKVGDTVLVQKPKDSKLSAEYEQEKFVIRDMQGSTVTVQSPSGVVYKRNTQHIKPFVKQERIDPIEIDDEFSDIEKDVNNDLSIQIKTEPLSNTLLPDSLGQETPRPQRDRKLPNRFSDFIMS